MILKCRLKQGAFRPTTANEGDAGADLKYPYNLDPLTIHPGQFEFVDSGVAIQGVNGYHIDVRSRSGLAVNHKIFAFNGLIDSGYTGSIGILLLNAGHADYTIMPGDRIAQLVLSTQEDIELVVVDKLTETERGENGFGSSGK